MTDAGRDFLGPLLVAMRWGDQWYFQPDTRPQKGTHTSCGAPLEAVLRCTNCREVVRVREVMTSPGQPFTTPPITAIKGAKRRRPGLELLERNRSCSIARTLMVTGEWWSGLIVRECFFGTRRFDDFQRRLDIAPNILSQRLQRLVQLGIIAKVADDSWAVRHEYRLTDKGADLYHVPLAILTWGQRWLGAAESDTTLTHTPCGADLRGRAELRGVRRTDDPRHHRACRRSLSRGAQSAVEHRVKVRRGQAQIGQGELVGQYRCEVGQRTADPRS